MPDSSKRVEAMVPLREILSSDNMAVLLASLASRAASNAANGSFSKVCARITRLTGYQLPSSIEAEIAEIITLRNAIVHDGDGLTREKAAVPARFTSVLDFLRVIAQICKDQSLPYSDDGWLVDDYWQHTRDDLGNES